MTYLVNKDFLTEASKGKIKGTAIINKFGRGTVGTGYTNIWAGGPDPYNYTGTPTTYYVSSTSASDTTPFFIATLDNAGDYQFETLTLNGQTQVATAITDNARLFRAKHAPTGGGWAGSPKLVGDVYIAKASGSTGGIPTTSTDIVAKIEQNTGQTQLGLTTIPNGYTGFLLNFRLSTESNKILSAQLEVREFGASFLNRGIFESASENDLRRNFQVFNQIPSRADVQFLAKVGTGSALVSIYFDILLVRNNLVEALSFEPDA